MNGQNFSLTKHLIGCGDSEVAQRASLSLLEKLVSDGDAAFERGEYTHVKGPEGSQALLDRLNAKAAGKSAPTARR